MRRLVVAGAMAAALALGVTGCGQADDSGEPATTPAAQVFASSQYGLELPLPPGWNPVPATEPWDGGDIDHTAAYADRLFTPGSQELFILGQSTALDLQPYVDTHTAWLTANRGCAAPAATSEGNLGGQPARLLEIHCPEGVFGPTLVLKAISVAQGKAVIVTSFTPDGNVEEDSAAFESVVESMAWRPGG